MWALQGAGHLLIYTQEELFTFGLNVGQIGDERGQRSMISPLKVSHMNFVGIDTRLEHIVTSDEAIVCATNRGEV